MAGLIQQDLYFELNLPNGNTLSEAEFQTFVDNEITPRFPFGLTILDGDENFSGGTGNPNTKVVTLYAEDIPESQTAIDEIAEAYSQDFGVDVLQVTNEDDLKVGFGAGENLIDNDPVPELIQVDLFFGRNIAGVGEVSPEQFQTFVDTVITPRFADGLTIFDAAGQFLSSTGTLIREPSNVVSLIFEDTQTNETEIDEIVASYIQQFQQESVLLAVNEDIKVAFDSDEKLIDHDPIPEQIQVDLFFGRNIAGVGEVSEVQFQNFLDTIVAPRFTEFTVFDAAGQFLSSTNALIKEPSKVVSFFFEDTRSNETAINTVIDEYIEQFQQESVLVVIDEDIETNVTEDVVGDDLISEIGIDLSDFDGQLVSTTISLSKNAASAHQGGFYKALDSKGTVIDPLTGDEIAPGETGYTEAALRQSAAEFEDDNTFSLLGGSYYIPYLVVDGDLDSFYTPFAEANLDRLDHVQLSMGDTFKFEDQFGLGDKDFNDFVLQVSLTPALAGATSDNFSLI